MEWYYAKSGERTGPLDDEAFHRLVREGEVTAETLVWNAELPGWGLWCDLAPTYAANQAVLRNVPVLATCAECGGVFASSEGVTYRGKFVCAACKPVFFQRVKQGSALPGEIQYGQFWRRAGAKMIDYAGQAAVSYALMSMFTAFMPAESEKNPETALLMFGGMMGSSLALLVVVVLYESYLLWVFGATPGKMMLGLRVVTPDMQSLSYGRALGRSFAERITSFTCGIGYLMPLFDDEARTLHDHMASTRVIHERRDH